MASKDRIQKVKDHTRQNILSAAIDIAREEGWPAVSMRKIADKIDYTAPIIYEYFSNKEVLLQELTKTGYMKLARQMEEAGNLFPEPERQLEAMWLAYWNFAFADKELYQVMFGVEMNCSIGKTPCVIIQGPEMLLRKTIEKLVPEEKRSPEYIDRRYYTFWSVVHGLISINLTRQRVSDDINRQVLKDAIGGMIQAIKS